MVAIAGFDLIVALVWVGGLTILLLGKALMSWQRFRRTDDFAMQSRRLAEETRSMATTRAERRPADVIPFRTRSPSPAGQTSKL
jgi:Flp pilus assembly protein TadB